MKIKNMDLKIKIIIFCKLLRTSPILDLKIWY